MERGIVFKKSLLFFAALVLYTYGRQNHFVGDDDYLYTQGFSSFHHILTIPTSLEELKVWSKALIKGLFYLRHGPLPAAYFGLWYKLADFFQLPFSVRLIHLPQAVLAATTVVLFYSVLLKNQIRGSLAFLGALALAVSPIFTGSARGLGNYFVIGVLFTHVFLIWAFHTRSTALKAFALFQITVGDNLFFLTLPSFLLASALSSSETGPSSQPLAARIKARLSEFSPRWLWVPPLLATLLTLLATLIAPLLQQPGKLMPNTRLATVFSGHTHELGSQGSGFRLGRILDQFSLLGGEGLIVVIALLGLGLFFLKPRLPKARADWFMIFLFAGFFPLFFFITTETEWMKALYQIYVLVPLIYGISRIAELLARRSTHGSLYGHLLFVALIPLSLVGAVNFVWKTHFAIRPAFGFRTHGTVVPDDGARAFGYLMRRFLEIELPGRKDKIGVEIHTNRPDFSETGYRIMGGFHWDNLYLKKKMGFEGEVELSFQPTSAGLKNDCPGDGCAVVHFGPAAKPIRYDIMKNGEVLFRVDVYGLRSSLDPPFPPGALDAETLTQRFAKTYRNFYDYYSW